MDMTDDFDRRLMAMQRSNAPTRECDLAITAYERLRTARAIAASLLVKPSNHDVLAVFSELCAISLDKNIGGMSRVSTSASDSVA